MDITLQLTESKSPRHIARLFTSFIAAITLLVAVAAGPAPKADAAPQIGVNYFCQEAWLSPFGQSGDRCFAGRDLWGHIYNVTVQTKQRAGCVNYAGYYYELYASWNCTGNYSTTGITVRKDGGSYQGVIRNNNLSYGGNFTGWEFCCYSYD